jgi:regulator of protease activity HflC (stomatin/prohibitin superfamily)
MPQNRSFAALVFVVILAIGAAFAYARYRVGANLEAGGIGVTTFIIASLVAAAIQVADQWDRAVILRLGKFRALKGPGLFLIVPVLDAIPYWIDTRVITTGFKAEKTGSPRAWARNAPTGARTATSRNSQSWWEQLRPKKFSTAPDRR